MATNLMQGLAVLFALIACIIIYLVLLNIFKLIVSIRFISNLIKDFKRGGRKYKGRK